MTTPDHVLDLFDALRWIDGTPLREHLEPSPHLSASPPSRDPSPALQPALLDEVVELLARALVADLKAFPPATGVPPRGSDRNGEGGLDARP